MEDQKPQLTKSHSVEPRFAGQDDESPVFGATYVNATREGIAY